GRHHPRHPAAPDRRRGAPGAAGRAARGRRGVRLRHRRRGCAGGADRGPPVRRQPGHARTAGAVRARRARPGSSLAPLADGRLRDPAVAAATQVTASDVLAAQARLRRYLDVTPTHYAERFGTWLKLENLQRTGSYKVRGALNALLAARERGD